MAVAASDLVAANRGMILALGRYGARALAHLWPRLRFEDAQRERARAGLPLLRNLVATALVLPASDGIIVVGQPDPQEWNSNALLRRIVPATRLHDGDSLALLERSLSQPLTRIGADKGSGRETCFTNGVRNQQLVGDFLVQAADQARIAEHAPAGEVHRFTVYVLAALSEGQASALLWPLAMTLRDRLEERLGLEIVGLLSCGVYGDAESRRIEGATTHAVLRELDFFSQREPDLSFLQAGRYVEGWQGRRYFDRCYLLDSEKSSGTRARDEEEIIVTTGNVLEVLLTSDATDVIAECAGADDEYLHHNYPFSTLGSASTYIPIDQWQLRNQYRFELEILESEFLNKKRGPVPANAPAAQFSSRYTELRSLVARMVADCPFSLLGDHGGQTPTGDVGRLLRSAHLDKPVKARSWPAFPLPEIRVDPAMLRPTYRRQDPVDGRSYRLPPDEWLQHLYQHYGRLGGLSPEWCFPTDPEADQYHPPPGAATGTASPAVARLPLVPSSQRGAWFMRMRTACEASPQDDTAEQNQQPHHLPGRTPAGIVPEFADQLGREVIGLLEAGDQGLPGATDWVRSLAASLQQLSDYLGDYQLRLATALGGDIQMEAQGAGERRRSAFQRLLDSRPRPASLLGRLLAIATLLAVSGYYIFPQYQFPLNLNAYPWLLRVQTWLTMHMPVTAAGFGMLVGALAFGAILGVHRWQLWRAIHRIERDLNRTLNLYVNLDLSRAVQEGTTGLLPALTQELACHSDILLETLDRLQKHHDHLSSELAEVISRRPYVRQALAGLKDSKDKLQEALNDWEEKLQQEARPSRQPLLPPPLLSPRREVLEELFTDFVRSEVELARARRQNDLDFAGSQPSGGGHTAALGSLQQRLDAISERYAYVRRYTSLGDLLIATIGHMAQVRDIVPPAELRIERLLREKVDGFSSESFLAELTARAQVDLAWDREKLHASMPVPLGLISVERDTSFPDSTGAMDDLDLRRVVSLDPFAVTVVHLCHGFGLDAIPHFHAYRRHWMAMSKDARSPLAVTPYALSETGEYFEVAPPFSEAAQTEFEQQDEEESDEEGEEMNDGA